MTASQPLGGLSEQVKGGLSGIYGILGAPMVSRRDRGPTGPKVTPRATKAKMSNYGLYSGCINQLQWFGALMWPVKELAQE